MIKLINKSSKKTVLTNSVIITFIVLCFINLANPNPAFATTRPFDVTAVLITKLLKFITWPEVVEHKLKLCIFEDYRQASIRSRLLANGSLEKHFVIASKNNKINCQIIFLAQHSPSKLSALLSDIQNSGPVLTFSASEQYAKNGVMINFYTEGENIRFEVNWKKVKSAGFKISSRVLKLARIVE